MRGGGRGGGSLSQLGGVGSGIGGGWGGGLAERYLDVMVGWHLGYILS